MSRLSVGLSLACLIAGAAFYLASVSGLLFGAPTSPADVGLVSTSAIFVLFGLVGLLLGRGPRPAEQKRNP
jgi:hypothetical protein